MAERAQLQYQPITGPVWKEPVAERLAWLPRDGYVGLPLARSAYDYSVFAHFVLPPPFDPQNLEWIPSGKAEPAPPERRKLGDFQQPSFAALYNPQRAEWVPSARYFGRALPRALYDFSILLPLAIIPVPPVEVVVPPAGGDSARRLLRRRPLHYWEAAALKRLSQREVETSLVEELAYAEATIPKSLDDFEERVSHLREIAKRLDALRAYHELAKLVRSVIERFEETRIKQLADQDEENEINDLIQFL